MTRLIDFFAIIGLEIFISKKKIVIHPWKGV